MTESKLDDKTAIVTGAASGIGRGIALAFASEGANVVVADVRRQPKQGDHFETDVTTPTDDVVREEEPGSARYIETDVSDPSAVEQMVDATIEEFGRVDVLVNNAGLSLDGTTRDITLEEWERVRSVNLDGTFYCTKFTVPHIVEAEGAVINIASVMGTEGGGGPPYASSKAGVINLTRDLAVELGPEGVNVNAICPGYIKTPIQDRQSEEDIEHAQRRTLVPRLGEPADIGKAALFLASRDAEFVHGTALFVDGGWTAHRGCLPASE